MWPDRRLKQKVQPVEKIDENVEKIWSDLIETMEAMSCIGLASSQLGIMLSLIHI